MKDQADTSIEKKVMEVKKPDEKQGLNIEGYIKIFDPESGTVYVDKKNAIHYENFSVALAKSISNRTTGYK